MMKRYNFITYFKFIIFRKVILPPYVYKEIYNIYNNFPSFSAPCKSFHFKYAVQVVQKRVFRMRKEFFKRF